MRTVSRGRRDDLLRAAAAGAASGDTIDLRRLACGRITLLSGEIFLPQNNLALIGPGRLALAVSGNRSSRVINHEGRGTLRIQGISLSYGYIEGPSLVGACVSSFGSVELRHARVHHCLGHLLRALETDAVGGGIYAHAGVLLSYACSRTTSMAPPTVRVAAASPPTGAS